MTVSAYYWDYLHQTRGFYKPWSVLWLCGSIVAHPIIFRLLPSPSQYKTLKCHRKQNFVIYVDCSASDSDLIILQQARVSTWNCWPSPSYVTFNFLLLFQRILHWWYVYLVFLLIQFYSDFKWHTLQVQIFLHWFYCLHLLGAIPGRGHFVVFLGKTLNSHSASLHPGV